MRETVYLEEWCQKKSVSQAEVGRRTELERSHLSRIAKNHRAYSETRRKIERALRLDSGDLLRNPNRSSQGIDLLDVLKDPNARIGSAPIPPEIKLALRTLVFGLTPPRP